MWNGQQKCRSPLHLSQKKKKNLSRKNLRIIGIYSPLSGPVCVDLISSIACSSQSTIVMDLDSQEGTLINIPLNTDLPSTWATANYFFLMKRTETHFKWNDILKVDEDLSTDLLKKIWEYDVFAVPRGGCPMLAAETHLNTIQDPQKKRKAAMGIYRLEDQDCVQVTWNVNAQTFSTQNGGHHAFFYTNGIDIAQSLSRMEFPAYSIGLLSALIHAYDDFFTVDLMGKTENELNHEKLQFRLLKMRETLNKKRYGKGGVVAKAMVDWVESIVLRCYRRIDQSGMTQEHLDWNLKFAFKLHDKVLPELARWRTRCNTMQISAIENKVYALRIRWAREVQHRRMYTRQQLVEYFDYI